MHRMVSLVPTLSLLWLGAAAMADEPADTTALPPAVERQVDFVREIQPLFKTTCYSCHGAEMQEAGLRLDQKKRALEGGDSGAVIVPGDSAASRLIRMVAGQDDESGIMPPEGEGTPLTPEQVGILRAWIDQGAVWPAEADADHSIDHWSFQSVERPRLPAVTRSAWARNGIDHFVLAQLEQREIEPSPTAARAMLMKRLYLDLIGLLPTPAELQEFLADDRPGAYSRLVDRLLASPHYGERWGRHWLDLARYADSDGYEKDRPRPHAWRYRHWVINALNADLGYDRFTIQQLAGDMLPDVETAERIASGFHRNTLHNTEGGTDPEEDRVKKTVDRTNTMGTVWLGLTVGCAQCHSHKYDPLTQREYYQLYAFFNSIEEKDVPAPLPVDRRRYEEAKAAFDREHGKLTDQLKEYDRTELPRAQSEWEATALETAVVWRTVRPDAMQSRHGATLELQEDGSILATGTNQVSDVYTLTLNVPTEAPLVTAIRLEVLPDDRLPKKGPGRADNGNFVLTTLQVAARAAEGGDPVPLKLHKAQADFSQKDWPVAAAVNDDPKDGWAVSPEIGKRHVAVFSLSEPAARIPAAEDAPDKDAAATRPLIITLDQKYDGATHNLGRFRLSITSAGGDVTLDGLPAEVADALAAAPTERTAAQQKQIADYYRTQDPGRRKLQQQIDQHAARAPKPPGDKAQSVAQLDKPRETRIHVRGDFLSPGDRVEPDTPSVLHGLESRDGAAPDRLDLAEWLVSRENPLTARVTVNRVWQRFFGRGLVATVDDFGSQGAPPSHPQLLDWLAADFRDGGWSLKRLHRRIVTSSTYRQSSAVRPELVDVDPENVLLARQTRRRVEAEVLRDLGLWVSGLMDPRIGGPSVRPPQPAEYSKLTYANSARWTVSEGGDRYRRGIYTFFQRTSPYPMFVTFDAPDSNICCVTRSMSNTPLQALTVLNDPVFFEFSQSMGGRVVREVPASQDQDRTVAQRADYAFRLCLARPPLPAERDAVVALYRDQLAFCRQDDEATKSLVGDRAVPPGCSPEELAAWTIVSRTLMNLDEFITRE